MRARVLRAPPSFRDSDAPIASHLYLERTKRIEHGRRRLPPFLPNCLPIHSKTRYNKPSVTFGTDATTDATPHLAPRLAAMTARSHATEPDATTRIVRVGPRLPPGARVRVRTIVDPDPEWGLRERRDDDGYEDGSFGRAPRLGDAVEIAVHGWWRRRIADDAVTRSLFIPGCPMLVRFVLDGDEEDVDDVDDDDDDFDAENLPNTACPCVGIEAVVLTMVPGEIVAVAVPSGGGMFMPDPVGQDPCPSDEYYEWVVQLELISPAIKPDITAPFEECLAYANEKRRRGNKIFTDGEYARALRRYEEAAEVLERVRVTTTKEKEASDALVVVHVNAATALAKMSRFQEVKKRCDRALEIDGKSAKAMYRKALASESLGDLDEALEILTQAMSVSNDKAVRESFVRVRRALTVTTKKEKDVYVKMMQTSGDDDDKDDEMRNTDAAAERKIETRREGDSMTQRLAFWARERPIVAGALCLTCVAAAAHFFRRKDSGSTLTSTDARID